MLLSPEAFGFRGYTNLLNLSFQKTLNSLQYKQSATDAAAHSTIFTFLRAHITVMHLLSQQ